MKEDLSDLRVARSWCKLSKSALKHNIKQIRSKLPEHTGMMAVVKADAYGHGAIWTTEQALAEGCEYLAVATIDEAVELRQVFKDIPILILSPYHPGIAEWLIQYEITQTIASVLDAQNFLDDLELYYEKKLKSNYKHKKPKVHLKIDTGMNRIGFYWGKEKSDTTINSIIKICRNSMLEVEGIYTHFAVADEPDNTFNQIQFKRFTNILEELKKNNIFFKIKHCANSCAAFNFTKTALDFVRLGISLYGWCPDLTMKNSLDLKPVMSLFSRISSIHTAVSGDSVGYGMSYLVDEEMIIGTIETGYADGLNRHLSNKGTVMIKGQMVPIIGRICMDRTMLDLTNVADVKIGDEVLIFGEDSLGNYRDLDQLAEQAGTISYEILCGITKRVQRIFVD